MDARAFWGTNHCDHPGRSVFSGFYSDTILMHPGLYTSSCNEDTLIFLQLTFLRWPLTPVGGGAVLEAPGLASIRILPCASSERLKS